MKIKIDIFNINNQFKITEKSIKKIVALVFTGEKALKGHIGIIFVDDAYIAELNRTFLNKNETTDVLTFPLEVTDTCVNAEIYINLNRVAEQAVEYDVPFTQEISRIVIHGLLHLFGHDDHSSSDKTKMTERENHYIDILMSNASF